MSDTEDELKQQVAGELRQVRNRARWEPASPQEPSPGTPLSKVAAPLSSLPGAAPPPPPVSPDRSALNERWDVSTALDAPPAGRLGRVFSPIRRVLQRVVRFALGQLVQRQVEMNSAQVRFDNELVAYVDERIDRISAHYDAVLGLHGKRMEEIDERHLILQQELIQHVHDLVKRIDFVFETAEQNHLYLEGYLREVRDEARALAARLDVPSGRRQGKEDP